MTFTSLIRADELAQHLFDPDWIIVDCRFSLANLERGRLNYLKAHIPGAIYAHLDEDLSAPIIPGKTGRHPLPSAEEAARRFGQMGVGPGMQVVAYDDLGGALAAVRLWWMLRWLGHDAVAVLDGGWKRWVKEGRPVTGGSETRPSRTFPFKERKELSFTTEEVDALRRKPDYRVFDARAYERYLGQNETIDPVAGHIPGAYSASYAENLIADGDFRPPEELRQHYESLLGGIAAEKAIFYCGSGVTSIHNILAMQYAGMGEARLYAGSWSEWITDRSRPVAIGSEPG